MPRSISSPEVSYREASSASLGRKEAAGAIFRAIGTASGPLMRTMDMEAIPWAVAIAAMVSFISAC